MICGAGGQLGQKLIGAARALEPACRVFAYNRSMLDITEPDDLRAAFRDAQPTAVFNAAAYTAVDRAESEPERAEAVNIAGAERLAAAAREHRAAFFHFSTDYVYADGYNRPLSENDRTQGTSVYARTKLAGEVAVLRANDDAYILRTSWVYAEYGHNFVRTMLRLGRERDELNIVADQVGSPTYAADLAAAALQLWRGAARPGVYNFANSGVCSWYDLALAIHELAGIDCTVSPIRTEQYPTPAKRPSYSVLDTTKITEILGAPPRHWRAALAECMAKA